MRFRATVFLILLLISVVCSAEKIFYLMGTYAVMDLPAEEQAYTAYRYLKSLEDKLSSHRENSEISLLNRKAGKEAVRVSPETLEVLQIALSVFGRTYGVFDITADERGRRIGAVSDIVIEGRRVMLRRGGVRIDLGGIGKGFAVEKVYHRLSADWGFIGIAGDMKVWGHSRILGVKDPLKGGIPTLFR